MRAIGDAGLELEEIHRRRADEAGDEQVGGAAIDLHRRADLLQLAAAHDRDPVGQHHRLFLIVGDEDDGDAELALQPLDLGAGLDPQGARRGWRAARPSGRRAGLRTTARPTATRWRWPPLSSAGRRSSSGSRPEQLGRRRRPAVGSSLRRACCWRRPKLMLSRTDMCG